MGATPHRAAELRRKVEAAVLKAVERVGPERFDRAAVVRPFLGRGVHRATLFRWVASVLASGKPAVHVTRLVVRAAEARSARQPDPAAAAAEIAAEMGKAIPALLPPVALIAGGAKGTLDLLSKLDKCFETAEQVAQHARNADGTVRLPMLLLHASEHCRRVVETAVRANDTIRGLAQMERFAAEILSIIEDVAKEVPEAAALILRRTQAAAARWCPDHPRRGRP